MPYSLKKRPFLPLPYFLRYSFLIPCIVFALSTTLMAAPPVFDTNAYCDSIIAQLEPTDDKAMFYSVCVKSEERAKASAEALKVPKDIEKICTSIATFARGSYGMYHTCIKSELKERLAPIY